MDWFHRIYEGRETFSDQEEEKAFRENQSALTRPEVTQLCHLLDLASGSLILDAYCGNGRHAMEFAHRGYRVIGLDIAASRIGFAQKWARDEESLASFLIADARALPFRGSFQAIMIFGGSFTHCRNEGENLTLLRGFKAVLRPGGRLLIDNPNPVRFWRIQHPHATPEEFAEVNYFDMPLGLPGAFGYVRYYSAPETQRLLNEAGFRVRPVLGDRTGTGYTFESPRLIVMAEV